MALSLEQLDDFVDCVLAKTRPDVKAFARIKVDAKDDNVLILPVRRGTESFAVRLNRNTMSLGCQQILDELEVELGKLFGSRW